MNIVSRRLVAVAATSTLVSVPAVAFIGAGSAADASEATGTPPRVGVACRTATPAGLLATPAGLFGGLLGVLTGSGSSGSDPVSGVIDQVQGLLDTAATDPAQAAAGIAEVLANLPTGDGGSPPDLAALTDEITALLQGDFQGDIPGATELLDTLAKALALPPDVMALFPSGLPQAVLDRLSGEVPTSVEDLVTELATALARAGEATVPPELEAALPASLLDSLRDALTQSPRVPITPPVAPPVNPPVSQPVTHPVRQPTSHPAGCTTPSPKSRCARTTAKARALQHKLKVAKKRHHPAKVKALKKKLAKAKRAKRHAC
jgi:hypothetical protein